MKLEKAIEIVRKHNDKANSLLYPEFTEATKLLIEAGKWVELIRPTLPISHKLLPGETK